MKDSKKKSPKEPVFLLETSHQLRSLMMKRGLTLRTIRARTLGVLSKGGPKSWVEMKLVAEAGESVGETWDKAHQLAGKIKRELHSDVYVESASQHGRFKEMTSPALPSELESPEDFLSSGPNLEFGLWAGPRGAGMDMGPGMGGASLAPGMQGAFGNAFGMGHSSGRGNPFGMGNMNNLHGMLPNIPDPLKDLLPEQVRQVMGATAGAGKKEKRVDLSFPALRNLPGWADLSENKQKMFEVEAAQLAKNGLAIEAVAGDSGLPQMETSALELVRLQPNVSKMLRHFLEGSATPAAD
jgi:hypothetical protein